MKNKIAHLLYKLGFSANVLTITGFALAAACGWSIWSGEFIRAAALLTLSGLVDLMDGAVARLSGKQSAFGGIFDSTLDRYGDACVYAGMLFYFVAAGRLELALLAGSAWTGAFMISYVRARAECEMDSCRVGFWERGERIGVLALALAVNNLPTAIWLLGLATHSTAVLRLYAAWKPGHRLKTPSRNDRSYFLKLGLLVLILLVVRVP